jgi:hypothetical protein
MTVFLMHAPTGIRVEEMIQEGHYSRREQQKMVASARVRLLPQLEEAVAAHLRVPGR